MCKSLHTPLPWVINDTGLIFGQVTGDDDEVPLVADVICDRQRAGLGILTDTEQANGELIVTACNAHAAMLEALELAVSVLEFDCHVDGSSGDYMDAIHSGKSAIALARSEG